MRTLLLDNYDSYTWNLYHLLAPHVSVEVVRNDAITVEEAAGFDRIVLSPGPGLPSEAGIMPALLRELMPTHPILGVCLGLQGIVEACGGSLYNLERVRHGVPMPCIVASPEDPLFDGLPAEFEVGLYHSWAANGEGLPPALQVTARGVDGVIMAIRHRHYDVCAVQFHPESVLTPLGPRIIRNWLGQP